MNMIKLNKVMDEGSKRIAMMLNRFYIVIKTFIKCTSFSIYLKYEEKKLFQKYYTHKTCIATHSILFLHNKLPTEKPFFSCCCSSIDEKLAYSILLPE